jgi:hypothetical protein
LEQNYEYDIVSIEKLLEKFINKEVSLNFAEGESISGMLLSWSSDGVLIETDSKMSNIKTDKIVGIDFNETSDNLITRPTLVWLLQSDINGKEECEISYLTNGISWEASYVATIDDNDRNINLDGWVSIDNRSGMTYKNAGLKLVAGDVNIVPQPKALYRAEQDMIMQSAPSSGFSEEALFEYHLYSLDRKTTVADREMKQLSLFPMATAGVEKIFVFDTRKGNKVRVNVEFENKKSNGLGMPLPKGKVRVYKKDSDGMLQFIGEDRIDHTPKDEKIRLFLGNAFDIVAEFKTLDRKRISENSREETREVVIRNHKDEKVTVTVVDYFWGDWYVIKSTHEHKKVSAQQVEFEVSIPKDGEAKLQYSVRF